MQLPKLIIPYCLFLGLTACQSDSSSDSENSGGLSMDAAPSVDDDMSRSGVDTQFGPNECRWANTASATAACLLPNRSPEYYVAEAEAYFDTLDLDADRSSVPDYHQQVIRWEWPPWLLLTGYTGEEMILTNDVLRSLDPSTVPERDCRFFETQPFARCYVEFEYERGRCPIYEEFTFDAEGKMTFIEAWSNLPGLLPNAADDPWAEVADYPRLANRVPGLGASPALLDFQSEAVSVAIMEDSDLASLALRTDNWRFHWFQELESAQADFFGVGCGWPPLEEEDEAFQEE